jgi:hypothetical protein
MDDMFAQLQPATMKDALGAKDEVAKAAIKREAQQVTVSNVPQAERLETPLLVIDPSKLQKVLREDLEDAVVGTIPIPKTFCGLDSTGCKATSDSRHMFSFTKEHGWWVHMDCGNPTRKWYTGAYLDLVETDDQELSWLHDDKTSRDGRG